MEEKLWAAVEALVSAIGAKNNATTHAVNVAYFSESIANALGLSSDSVLEIRLGALLHDIGQILIPESLFSLAGESLSEEEKKLFLAHPRMGATLIESWSSLKCFIPYVLYHQEKVDGSGYPFGLQGDALPKRVQIISVADVYDALRQARPHRKRFGLSKNDTIEIMSQRSGKSWDEDIFEAFLRASANWDETDRFR